MGRHPIAEPLYEARLAAHERARQQRLGGDANDWRGGHAHRLERSKDSPRLSDGTGFRHCRLQGTKTNLAPLESAIAPAYSAWRWPDDRLGFAARRFSAPNFRTRYARLRRARNKVQIAMTFSIKSRMGAIASHVFALHVFALHVFALHVFALHVLAFATASEAFAFTAYVSN